MSLFQECDLGQRSILHAIKSRPRPTKFLKEAHNNSAVLEEESAGEEPSKPLCETLVDLQLQDAERVNIAEEGKNFS